MLQVATGCLSTLGRTFAFGCTQSCSGSRVHPTQYETKVRFSSMAVPIPRCC